MLVHRNPVRAERDTQSRLIVAAMFRPEQVALATGPVDTGGGLGVDFVQRERLGNAEEGEGSGSLGQLQGEMIVSAVEGEEGSACEALTNAIKLAIAGKVHDEGLVTSLFDKSKLILSEDGKIAGLDEQLKNLNDTKKFLFKEENLAGHRRE
ncbi:MAG: phage scaffolding protein [Verrucomicrobiota bacterium]